MAVTLEGRTMDGNYWTRGRVSRRSMLRGAAVGTAGVAGAVLIGCGDSDDDPTATPDDGGNGGNGDGTPAATSTAAPDPGAPKSGGKLTLHMGTEPRSLDPHFETFTPAPSNATSNNLVRFTPDLTTIVPDAAELPEQPDDLTYIFKLQPGVAMHDVDPLNGRALTSEDVKYTVERQTNQAGDETGTYQHAYYFKDRLASIETPDDQTIVFTTNEPYAPFMNYMASPWSPIVAREYVEANGDLTEYVGASGPYILDEWQKEVRMTFKANPNYWKNPDLPYVDELEFLISPDPDTAATQFIDGAFKAYVSGQSQLERVQSSRGDDTRYTPAPSQFWRQFRMSPTDSEFGYLDYAGTDNETGALFDDIRVRQAICQSIDKQAVLDFVYSGDGQITFGPILPQFTNWALTEELVPFDPAEAAKLMQAAGVEEIRGPMMWASSSPQADQIGEIIKRQLAEINVITDLEPMETAAYYNVTYAYRYTFSHHVPLNSPEPDENLSSYFGENSTYFKHFNPEIFDLVRRQATTVDFEERQAVVKEAQEKIVLDYPIRFMFTTNVHQFIDNTLKDYEISLDRYDNYGVETAWLDA